MERSKLMQLLDLENTRIIYNGIKKLNDLYQNEKDVQNLVKSEYENCKDKDGDKNIWLRQNTMCDFFRFMCLEKSSLESDDIERIAHMLLLYNKVTDMLEEHQRMSIEKDYVSAYTKVCEYICKIAKSQECYLIHLTSAGGHMLAQYSEQFDVNKENENVNLIIKKVHKKIGTLDEAGLEETVILNEDMLILMLLVSRRRDEKYKQKVGIVLKDVNPASKKEVSRSILFLRQQLQQLLERDIYALQHFQMSYEAVMPITQNQDVLKILHITDLHVSDGNEKKIVDAIKESNWMWNNEKLIPDLILITGDVVQGRNAASDMEANYEKAAHVIRELAVKLWFNHNEIKDQIFDWKKRIIIIPGNHDYASMNELKAAHINRTTSTGVPAEEEGSPMVKFGYFINFLQRLLDVDMAEMIRNNLNGYRVYEAMGLEIVCLNTVSEASMWRNNKMTLDKKFVESIPDCSDRKQAPFIIYLGHHTPIYKNSYNKDNYWFWGMTNEMYNFFCEVIQIIEKGSSDSNTNKIKEELQKKEESSYFKALKNSGDSALKNDTTYLIKHGHELNNERCKNIICEYNKNKLMERIDYDEYAEYYKKLNSKLPNDIFLGGHTHVFASNVNQTIFEGPRFFNASEQTTLHYGVLTINKRRQAGEKRFSYELVPPLEYIKGEYREQK